MANITAKAIFDSYFGVEGVDASVALAELDKEMALLTTMRKDKRAELKELSKEERKASLDEKKALGEAYFTSLDDGATFEVTYKGNTETFTKDITNASPKSGKFGSAWGMFNGEAKKVTFDKVIVPADFSVEPASDEEE